MLKESGQTPGPRSFVREVTVEKSQDLSVAAVTVEHKEWCAFDLGLSLVLFPFPWGGGRLFRVETFCYIFRC